MAQQTNTFYAGLCMAGAVSAGAYSAGVLDFLLQALEEWERNRNQADCPSHNVVIPVIGGASAGGMTGILAAAAINTQITPVAKAPGNLMDPEPGNIFYHTWVDLTTEDMVPLLLDSSDIRSGKIYSLLNSGFIEQIADRISTVNPVSWRSKPYIADHLKVFTTFTNLQGFNCRIGFKGALRNNSYEVARHNDFGQFVLNTSTYNNDGWIPLDFRSNLNVDLAKKSAMATGAFPIGLRARRVNRDSKYLNESPWHTSITSLNPLPAGNLDSLIVDGGVINNEPFEKVRELLIQITNESEGQYTDYSTFKSTVIMIDPFPIAAEEFKGDDTLFGTMGSTFSAMLGHLRTKPEVLHKALLPANAGQFLIAPTREINGNLYEGSRAIACGFLDGFGGFLHKHFRIHDYFLGRANCEQFLREHFTVPVDTQNPIFKDGYAGVQNKGRFLSSNQQGLQIIPIFQPKKPDMYLPIFDSGLNWPVKKHKDVDRYRAAITKRAGKLIMNISDYKWHEKALLWLGNRILLRRKLADLAMNTIKSSMISHNLLN